MHSSSLGLKTTVMCILLVALLTGLSFSVLAQPKSPAAGFDGLSWGQSIADQPDFKKIRSKGNADFYIRENSPLMLYGKHVERVVYGAKDGNLFAVYIHLEDPEVLEKLAAELSENYGEPKRKTIAKVLIREWQADDAFTLKLKDYEETGVHKIGVYYEPVAKDVNMDNMDLMVDKIYEGKLEDLWLDGVSK